MNPMVATNQKLTIDIQNLRKKNKKHTSMSLKKNIKPQGNKLKKKKHIENPAVIYARECFAYVLV